MNPLVVLDPQARRRISVSMLGGDELNRHDLTDRLAERGPGRLGPRGHEYLAWLRSLQGSMGHVPYLLRATTEERTVGALPLALVRSTLFGRFLVSLPYVNSAGVIAEDDTVAAELIGSAVKLADQCDVRYLELRHERAIQHPALKHTLESKVLMRLRLPSTAADLWSGFKSKLRSQIKSGEKHGFEVAWGREELLQEFYAVFSRNMRDLGTPVYPCQLFAAILENLGEQAELCVVRAARRPIAAALLIHGTAATEVPSASSLREFNSTNANMVMYWHLLRRAVERGQQIFDFGRSTVDGNTFRFKKQWGAEPSPSIWQYYLRRGDIADMRPTNSRYGLAIRVWQRLPLPLANMLGPLVVRGIP